MLIRRGVLPDINMYKLEAMVGCVQPWMIVRRTKSASWAWPLRSIEMMQEERMRVEKRDR